MFALDICFHSSLYGFSADSYSAEMTVSTKQASLPLPSAHARAKLDLPFDMQKVSLLLHFSSSPSFQSRLSGSFPPPSYPPSSILFILVFRFPKRDVFGVAKRGVAPRMCFVDEFMSLLQVGEERGRRTWDR
ncbi:hypothetical protein AVEN_4561-1 [Araneus ventricosus]|uniref:Uncharacterized protein n=1 Tax=Araneus ventricosus TaxID=182803 RepID=A0A4Y2BLP0_ARAVE|nr:hypothetical protein AVEN_4561-1 [Araneus ventricosus]